MATPKATYIGMYIGAHIQNWVMFMWSIWHLWLNTLSLLHGTTVSLNKQKSIWKKVMFLLSMILPRTICVYTRMNLRACTRNISKLLCIPLWHILNAQMEHVTSYVHMKQCMSLRISNMMQVLKERNVPIHKIIHFSDQAPLQYKYKTNFKYISDSKLCWMCNFFGVRHGKGPCDSCAGRVNNKLVQL